MAEAARGLRWDGVALDFASSLGCDAIEPFFECPGAEQALGDAGDDQLDIVGAEVGGVRSEIDFLRALQDCGVASSLP